MDPEYRKKMLKWVEYDSKVQKNKEDMQDVVEKKKILEDDIIKYVEQNNMDHKFTFTLQDGSIKFSKRNSTQPLSMKTLKTILEKYNIDNDASIDIPEIAKYISDNLEVKQKTHMAREVKQIIEN